MKKYIAFLTIVLALAACKKAQPTGSQYQAAPALEASTGTVQFESKGGSSYVSVTASGTVEASTNCDWVSVSVSGKDVFVSAEANESIDSRYAVVSIKADGKAKSVQVIQFGYNSLYIWEDEYSFDTDGGAMNLYYEEVAPIKIKINGSDWISAVPNDGVLAVTVASNSDPDDREGSIVWKSGSKESTVVIKQKGGAVILFNEDFESEDNLAEWLLADVDGDGHSWRYSSLLASHSGIGVMNSASYDNDSYSALTPDNWMVTPGIKLSTKNYVSFWVTAQDSEWVEEHYGVYISVKQPETYADFDNFEKLFEATNPVSDPYEEEEVPFEGTNGTAMKTWQRIAIQIPASYDGKTVYIAFRHFDCTDMYLINVDDVMVSAGAPEKTASSKTSVSSVRPAQNVDSFVDYKRR